MTSQSVQQLQFSGRTTAARPLARPTAWPGHSTTQRPQPVHFSASISGITGIGAVIPTTEES